MKDEETLEKGHRKDEEYNDLARKKTPLHSIGWYFFPLDA